MKRFGLLVLVSWFCLAGSAMAGDYGPYKAVLVRVIDGDSVVVDVDLWPGLAQRVSVRLAGINAPELRAPAECERLAAQKAMDAVQALVTTGTLTLTDVGPDKYWGRIVGKLWVVTAKGKVDLGQILIERRLAKPYSGGKRLPWCG